MKEFREGMQSIDLFPKMPDLEETIFVKGDDTKFLKKGDKVSLNGDAFVIKDIREADFDHFQLTLKKFNYLPIR